MKLNNNLKYREYNDVIIILPEGENCFVLNGIAFEIFKLLSANVKVSTIKNKLSKDGNNKRNIDSIIDKMVELKILI